MCSDLADGQKDVILHPCLPSCLHKVNDLHTMFFTTLVKKWQKHFAHWILIRLYMGYL